MTDIHTLIDNSLWSWREHAELTTSKEASKMLGETEDGDLLVPRRDYSGIWDDRCNLRKPQHWLPYFRSRRRNMLMLLEGV